MRNAILKFGVLILLCRGGIYPTPVYAETNKTATPARVEECDSPAPTNFHVTNASGNSISLAWNRVPGVQYYTVKLYEEGHLALVAESVTDQTEVTMLVTDPRLMYTATVSSGGPECGSNKSVSVVGHIIVIVVDLIADKNAPIPNLNELSLDHPNGCFNVTWGNNHNYYLDFVHHTPTGNLHSFYEIHLYGWGCNGESGITVAQLTPEGANPEGPQIWHSYPFGINFLTNAFQSPPVLNVYKIRIRQYLGNREFCDLFDIRMSYECEGSLAICVDPASSEELCDDIGNYSVRLMQAGEISIAEDHHSDLQPKLGTIRPEPVAITSSNAPTVEPLSPRQYSEPDFVPSVTPNPFGEMLNIRLNEQGIPGITRIRLLSLSGAPVRSDEFAGRQEYTLHTSGLPAGFYLLQVEAGGQSRIYKLVKGMTP